MKDKIKLERIYDCQIDRVWNALTDAEAMSQWLMPCDIVPIVGHKFQFRTEPQLGFDGIVNCEIVEVVPKEKLAFTWCNGKMNTEVSFQLEPIGNTTKLHLEHSGFSGIFERIFVRQLLSNGWKKKILKQLEAYLEK
ncbi:MAG: SRPBCC domain-containing protein [Maribacter sp.]|uniref:SRPBCC family protein n=1 Tax=Maribacter sp. TaxID=1897614 RepID=UPI003298B5DC